jgi:hypothetical protein
LSFAEVIEGLVLEHPLRSAFLEMLAASPYSAYRWETPPLTAENLDRDFECVFLDSPHLDIPPNPREFDEYFSRTDEELAVAFPNLGHDGIMISPCPTEAPAASNLTDSFSHLGAFTRTASMDRQHALWRAVGRSLQERIGAQPVWWSTAGGGVPWLHVRLDDRPKYYGHTPYRNAP